MRLIPGERKLFLRDSDRNKDESRSFSSVKSKPVGFK